MTTYAESRDVIVGKLEAAWPAAYPNVPLFYDNGPKPDRDRLAAFVGCGIDYMGAVQREIGPTPAKRNYGSLSLVIAVKSQTGSRGSLVMADFLSDLYRFSMTQGVVFQAPHLLPPVDKEGWFMLELLVPFYFDG